MKSSDVIAELALVLNTDPDRIEPDTALHDVPGWDSLALVGVLAIFDRYCDPPPQISDIQECRTFGDLVRLSGIDSGGAA